MEEAWKTDVVISVASDNAGSECKNDIVTEMEESDDGSVKPSPPSGMCGLMHMLFIFGIKYIY